MPLTHQYQQGDNGQPVKIQELRTFLQTNTVRSRDIDKIHFSHCWLRLCQMQANSSSLNLEQTFYRLAYSPIPLYLKFSCETVDCSLWTVHIPTSISYSKKLAIFQHLTKVGCYLPTESTEAIWKRSQGKMMKLFNNTLTPSPSP